MTLSCGEIGGGCEGTVERAGVCFLRHSKLKKLLQTYHADAGHSTTIEIEVTPVGIRVGRSEVSRAGWKISLFANPASAQKQMRFLSGGEQRTGPGDPNAAAFCTHPHDASGFTRTPRTLYKTMNFQPTGECLL